MSYTEIILIKLENETHRDYMLSIHCAKVRTVESEKDVILTSNRFALYFLEIQRDEKT